MDVFPPSPAKWSRLYPQLSFKNGSAPFSIRVWKAFCFPKIAAVISGVARLLFLDSTSRPSDNSSLIMDVFPPSAAKWSTLYPPLSFKHGSAPFCIRIWKAFCFSQYAAVISGVTPQLHPESISRPSDNSSLIMEVFPPAATKCSRLRPQFLFKDGLAPFCSNMWKAPSWPLSAVNINGVRPILSLESMSNSWDSNKLMISMHPVFAAAWSSWPSLSLYSDLESKSSESAGTVSLRMDETLSPGEKNLKNEFETQKQLQWIFLKGQQGLRMRNRKMRN